MGGDGLNNQLSMKPLVGEPKKDHAILVPLPLLRKRGENLGCQ